LARYSISSGREAGPIIFGHIATTRIVEIASPDVPFSQLQGRKVWANLQDGPQ
jgi:hypothetical protein